jgi:hypothetical protein
MTSFAEVEVLYKKLRGQLERGEITQEQFAEKTADLMCQDETGRWWTVHPESGMWHHRWKDEWRPGVPPGHTPAVVKRVVIPSQATESLDRLLEPEIAPEEEKPERARRTFPRWLVPALAALVLVVTVVVVVFLYVLPSWEKPQDEPVELQVTGESVARATFTSVPAIPASPVPTSILEQTASEEVPSPTASPLPEGPDAALFRPSEPPLLTDDFGDPTSGWSRGIGDGVVVDYRDGGMWIELQGGGRSGWSRYEPQSFSSGWIEVTVRGFVPSQAGAISMAGIAVNVTEDYYGLVFRVDSAGRYSVGRTLPLDSPPLVDWTFSEHIHTSGDPNRLALLSDEGRYHFFVNGWLLFSDEEMGDEAGAGGLLALWGASGQGFAAPVVFDDLVAFEVPGPVPGEVEPEATETPSPPVIPEDASPTEEVDVTIEPVGTISPTVEIATSPVPTGTIEALSIVVSHDSWYPGSGENWITRFRIEVVGGDGRYSYSIADIDFESNIVDLPWPCDSPLNAEIIVESGDGQQVTKSVWIAAVPCE